MLHPIDPGRAPEEKVACEYCSQWGLGGEVCKSCGAPIPPGPMYNAWLHAPRFAVTMPSVKGADFGGMSDPYANRKLARDYVAKINADVNRLRGKK